MSDFVTLGKFFTSIDAHQVKNQLESENILCLILNETSSQVYNFHTPTDGGIILKVHKNDLPNALKLLQDGDTEIEIDQSEWEEKLAPITESVPKDYQKRKYIFYVFIIVLVLLIAGKLLQ